MKFEDINDDSDSIFADDPLDEVEDEQINEDIKIRNKNSGKVYTVKKVNPKIHDVIKDDAIVKEPVHHDTDKVTLSKSGEPLLGKHPVEYEYDADDNLVAVDKVEKELSTTLASSMNTVRHLNTIIDGLKQNIKQKKDELERPRIDHDKVKQEIDSLEDTLAKAIDKQKTAKATMQSNLAKLDKYYKDRGEQ